MSPLVAPDRRSSPCDEAAGQIIGGRFQQARLTFSEDGMPFAPMPFIRPNAWRLDWNPLPKLLDREPDHQVQVDMARWSGFFPMPLGLLLGECDCRSNGV